MTFQIGKNMEKLKKKKKKNKCHEFGRREEWIKGAHRLWGGKEILHITIIVSMSLYI